MAESLLQPAVADNLLGDESVLSLMGQPKMVEAIRTLKEDPKRYHELVASDPELATMMRALQTRMGEAEAEVERPAVVANDVSKARDAALAHAQKGEWLRAVEACDRGLRGASGEPERELKALRARYLSRSEDEAAARAEAAARSVQAARQEVADAVVDGSDLPRLQAAVDEARRHSSLKGEPIVSEAQRLLVRLLEAKSGERMRQLREQARLAAVGAAVGQAAPAVEPVQRLAADPPCEPSAPLPECAANEATGDAHGEVTTRADVPANDAAIRAIVLENPLLFEID